MTEGSKTYTKPPEFVKKYYTLIICIAVCLCTACNTENEIAPAPGQTEQTQDMPILFGTTMPEAGTMPTKTTRATDLESIVKTFKIYGYKNTTYTGNSYDPVATNIQHVFPSTGYDVWYTENSANSTESNTSGWDYVGTTAPDQTIKYWDMSATAYRFMGYAVPTGGILTTPDLVKTTDGVQYRYFNVNVSSSSSSSKFMTDADVEKLPYVTKLWMSNGNTTATNPATGAAEAKFGQEVQLIFYKPLSRVRFIITGPDGNPLSQSQAGLVSNIQFGPVTGGILYTGATLSVYYPLNGTDFRSEKGSFSSGSTYYTAPTGEQYVVSNITNATADYMDISYETTPLLHAGTDKEKWYNLPPEFKPTAYQLTLQQKGVERTATVPADMMVWLPGYEYTYVFKLSEAQLTYVSTHVTHTKWQVGYTGSQATW